jgi:hypothetical protein
MSNDELGNLSDHYIFKLYFKAFYLARTLLRYLYSTNPLESKAPA